MQDGVRLGIAGLVVLLCAGLPSPGQAQRAEQPTRVARVSRIEGIVSFHPVGAVQWTQATLNLPVTTGTALWTEPGAQAEIGFPGTRLALDGASELDMEALDAHRATAWVPQGAVYVAVRLLPAGDTLTVQTPRGTVALLGIGRYEVVAGDAARPTTVTVVEGSADVAAAGLTVRVGLNQIVTVTGDGGPVPFAASLAPAAPDAFLTARLVAEQPPPAPPPPRAPAVPAYVADMTGGEALDGVGTWDTVPIYGSVWYPPVGAGFVPYRDGHWAWLAPWGWTWVDAASWGFAPSHYGRWLQVRDRWGWVPGPPERAGFRPVFAPAVVGFLGGAVLARAGVGAVGWFPLGPGATRPSAHGGPAFANRAGATVVPSAVMASGGQVAGAIQTVPGVAGLPVVARPAVVPTAATPGVTPAVIRQMRLPAQMVAGAPGPAIAPGVPRGILLPVPGSGPRLEQTGSVPPLTIRPEAAGGPPGTLRPGRASAPTGLGASEAPTPEVIRPPNADRVPPGGIGPVPGVGRPGEASRAPLPTVIAPDRPVQTELRGQNPTGASSRDLEGSLPGGGMAPGEFGRTEGGPVRGGAGLRPEFAPRPSLPRPSLPRAILPALRGSPGLGLGPGPGLGFR